MRRGNDPLEVGGLTLRFERATALLTGYEAWKEKYSVEPADEQTVKAHVSSILRNLGVRSRTQAALHAVRTGLVSVEELGDESW